MPATVVERPWTGIGYADETLGDRDTNGVLWQRRAMRRLLCGICAGPPDRTELGVLWLVRDFRDDWPGWPERMAATEPPVCLPCARRSIRVCPALRKGHVAIRVGDSRIAGVYGASYQTGQPFPSAVSDAIVTFDEPAIRWTCATQLVRELRECVIVKL